MNREFLNGQLPYSHHKDHLGESIPHSRGKDLHKLNNPEPYQHLDITSAPGTVSSVPCYKRHKHSFLNTVINL